MELTKCRRRPTRSFSRGSRRGTIDLRELLGWTEDDYRTKLRGSPLRRGEAAGAPAQCCDRGEEPASGRE